MFNRVKSVLYNVVGGLEALPVIKDVEPSDKQTLKFPYTRPHFLQLTTEDEVQVSADHSIRPIIVPRDMTKLPWNSGYAEAINAGKSVRNEDQAAVYRGLLCRTFTDGQINIAKENCSVEIPPSQKGDNPDIKAVSEKVLSEEIDSVAVPSTSDNINSLSLNESHFTTPPSTPEPRKKLAIEQSLPWIYFGLFDGHAGSGVAVAAAKTLHTILQEKLISVLDLILPLCYNEKPKKGQSYIPIEKTVSIDSLITGALETAFLDMDEMIARDKHCYKMTGGCTAIVALFILGKLYVANAGDSRSVICQGNKVVPMSADFTPETEKERIKKLGYEKPELLGNDFTYLEFVRRPTRKDIGKKLLYRDAHMTGWAYKIITVDDLKFPLVYGEGKRSRALATIGVTRGFGDHDLKAQNSNLYIKPFLSPQPEIKIFDLGATELTDSDVLIMGTDGLWDITSNEKAASVVQKSLDHFPANDMQRYKYRYISAAQDLVMHSRGKLRERYWRTADNTPATIDDISVFVIPLRPYIEEYKHWKSLQTSLSDSQ